MSGNNGLHLFTSVVNVGSESNQDKCLEGVASENSMGESWGVGPGGSKGFESSSKENNGENNANKSKNSKDVVNSKLISGKWFVPS